MDNKGKQFKNSDFPNGVLCDWPIKWAILNQQTTKLKSFLDRGSKKFLMLYQ